MVMEASSCQMCGRELGGARQVIVCGRTFGFAPSVCDGCAEAREAKEQARKDPSRNRWERLCPEPFRINPGHRDTNEHYYEFRRRSAQPPSVLCRKVA